MAGPEQPQLHRFGGGSPQAELGARFGKPGAQIIALVVEPARKRFAVKIHSSAFLSGHELPSALDCTGHTVHIIFL